MYAWKKRAGTENCISAISVLMADVISEMIEFCEPVHLSLEPERTVLAPIDTPPLTEAESRQLFDEAADSAREHGAVLRQAAGRWYLFPDEPWRGFWKSLHDALHPSGQEVRSR